MGITVTGGISFGSGLAVTAPAPPSYYVSVASSNSPSIFTYPWSSSSGFGTKFADPATVPDPDGTSVAFSPQGDVLALGHGYTQFSVYRWSSNGYGTKFADPIGFTGAQLKVNSFSPSGDVIACGSTNGVFVYPWSSISGFGTKFTSPAQYLGTVEGASFSPSGNIIALAFRQSPYVAVYTWSGSGFGTKFADPATLPPSTGYAVTFSPLGDAISVGGEHLDGIAGVSVYPWSGSGFGTKFTNPGTLPATIPTFGTAFSPSGNAFASSFYAASAPNGLCVWQWSGSGFGTKFANPSPTLSSQDGVAFSPLGDAIAVVSAFASPSMNAYPWSDSSGFGTRFANPATMPAPYVLGPPLALAFGTIQ